MHIFLLPTIVGLWRFGRAWGEVGLMEALGVYRYVTDNNQLHVL